MDSKTQALDLLGKRGSEITRKHALVGFDGLVERTASVADKRLGKGGALREVETMDAFTAAVRAVAGSSTDVKSLPYSEEAGGHGPVLADALHQAGLNLRYIGALGEASVHPVFEPFAGDMEAISVADPGILHTLEFADGKIVLRETASYQAIDYRNLLRHVKEGEFFDLLSRQDLISVVNWAMIPNLTALLADLIDHVLPNLPPRDLKHYFFDLSDSGNRSDGEVRSFLSTLSRFQNWGAVTLGLNFKEAGRVSQLLGQAPGGDDTGGLKSLAAYIRGQLNIGTVVALAGATAACATKLETAWARGYLSEDRPEPGGSTEHFNAGFSLAQLLDFPLTACLTTGLACRGYYVETGSSPSLSEIQSFIQNWKGS